VDNYQQRKTIEPTGDPRAEIGTGAASISLNLPYPPTANRIWIRAYKGMRLSGRYRSWLEEAGYIAIAQRAGKITGPYKLFIEATKPDRKKRDLDNIIKPISDLLVKIGTVHDDSLCQFISAMWIPNGDGVRVTITEAA